MKDLAHNLGAVQALAPVVVAATTTSDPIDLLGFASAAVFISTGAIASAGDFTAKLQASDTTENGDFADAPAADLIGAFPATLLTASVVKIGYIGTKRYIRTVITKNGGTSIAASALVVKGGARLRPVA